MPRNLRLLIAAVILIISLTLLIWGLLPARREIRTQPISPSELQLPTPSSFHFDSLNAAHFNPYPVS